jgi:glycosyltransferase involved in cell wall biosynthesis
MTGLPFVSVIVPVWNAADTLAGCLQALGRQDYPNDRYEVIVVDNGSTDRTVDVARGYVFVTLLHELEAGSYRARNLGLRHARGTLVAFTDADCIPSPTWLSAAVRAASALPEAGVLAGRIDLFGDVSGKVQLGERYERLFAFNQEANVTSGMCVTANWVSPKALLQELGGFDPILKSGGDAECARRLRGAGHPIVYVPDMVVGHPARASIGELIRKRRRVIGGRIMAERAQRKPISWLWTYLLITGAQTKRTWLASGLTVADRIALSLLIGLMGIASFLEILRIAGGGQPRRS